MKKTFKIKNVDTFVYRCPLESPVQTSFGIMHDRPMVLVRITDESGEYGWGEIWCNFPMVGAEHRARLIHSVFNPLLIGSTFDSPEHAYEHLTESTKVLSLQCAEPGPFSQCVAGIDIALWDLLSRKEGLPLWSFLGGKSNAIFVYASGLNPSQPEILAQEKFSEGYRSFKLKIGFGADKDIANLEALRSLLGYETNLMVDVNQGWTLEQAIKLIKDIEPFDPIWIEEPLRSDVSWEHWRDLQTCTTIPIAAGENILGENNFKEAIESRVLSYIQPDLAKWGGFTKCLPVAQEIIESGSRFFPHFLGGGVGLLASGHLLASVGGGGALEIDSNPNPLRTDICGTLNKINDSVAILSKDPGLGLPYKLENIEKYLVAQY